MEPLIETVTTLGPDFETDTIKYEGKYHIDVPVKVSEACRELSNLGGRALLVGGSVRDAVMSTELSGVNIGPKDFDLEVYGVSVDTLENYLKSKFGDEKVDTVGKKYGVIRVRIEGWDEYLDFSVPRRDSKVGVGHEGFKTNVDPNMLFKSASVRRDLTINALAYDPLSQTLYDAHGGVADIRAGRIELVDEKSFQEDPLRVLRVGQFASRFDFSISTHTKALCAKMVERGMLELMPPVTKDSKEPEEEGLTRERIAGEVKKLLLGKKPSIGLEFLREIGYVKKYWPEAYALVGVKQSPKWHPEGDVWAHTLQVVDAAANIVDREFKAGRLLSPADIATINSNLDLVKRKRAEKNTIEHKKLVVMFGTVCHDFGKPATTKEVVIENTTTYSSESHEQAGIKPAQEFLERLFADPKATGLAAITKEVLPLVADHMTPVVFWKNEVKDGIDQKAALRRLATRLSNGGASMRQLAWVVEADQRGRNPSGLTPLTRVETTDLEKKLLWFEKHIAELNIEYVPPKKLLTGDILFESIPKETLRRLDAEGKRWRRTVLDAVFDAQLEGAVTNESDTLAYALDYIGRLQ